jgi:DNA ligase D-like protein (predicted 3'-phosphoesterase)
VCKRLLRIIHIDSVMRYPRSRFVVQEHFARHHHYDFRLEMDGTLKSWAIPKEVPRVRKVKRLAVQVEDHDLDYIGFEGEIAEGQYGAGTVKIFDSGDYYLLEKKEDKIKVALLGSKLEGVYELIRLKDPKNWLMFMVGDRPYVTS